MNTLYLLKPLLNKTIIFSLYKILTTRDFQRNNNGIQDALVQLIHETFSTRKSLKKKSSSEKCEGLFFKGSFVLT